MQNLLVYNSIFGNLLGHGLFTNISVTVVVLNPETLEFNMILLI